MKKILVLMLFCSVFVLGCSKAQEETNEMFVDETVTESFEVDENLDVDNEQDIGVVNEALRVGMEQYNAGDFAAAIDTYTKAIETAGDNISLYVDRGRAKRDSGDIDGAIGDVSRALDLSQEGWIYAERGVAYSAKGEKELALQDFKKALSMDPSISWVADNIKELESK